MYRKSLTTGAVLLLAAAIPFRADAGTLRGSPSSMREQHEIAVHEDLTFTKKPSQVENLVDSGTLVMVESNEDFALSDVSFPFARPEVLLLIERLAAQYRQDNGEKLIVTSLTRPTALQPANAHKLSVHPAGMAVDFRVPATASERAWLEKALLGLENERVLDVTREKHPPHYHVAVFPAEYLAYAKARMADEPRVVDAPAEPAPAVIAKPAVATASSAIVETSAGLVPIVGTSLLLLLFAGLMTRRLTD
ncbi:MAG TPA: DUF5715 family protein [Gemmatimonadaceae bacterium]|nr:DUF5715 family protein [Gemmatimonadaceae bacterium]